MIDIYDIFQKAKIGCLSVRAILLLMFDMSFRVSTLQKNLKVYNCGLVMGCLLWVMTITTVSKANDKFEVNLQVKGLEWVLAEKKEVKPPSSKQKQPEPDTKPPDDPPDEDNNDNSGSKDGKGSDKQKSQESKKVSS